MVVTIQQLQNGIVRFVDKEIGFKSQGINKFMTYLIIPNLPNQITNIINKYRATFPYYFDENGNIIIDKLYSDSKESMQKTLQVELFGIIFKENDIDVLYNYITNNIC